MASYLCMDQGFSRCSLGSGHVSKRTTLVQMFRGGSKRTGRDNEDEDDFIASGIVERVAVC